MGANRGEPVGQEDSYVFINLVLDHVLQTRVGTTVTAQ